MARFSLNKLPEKERIRLIGEFYDGIAALKNREEVAKVFRDIMDGDEIGNIMRRIDVAVLVLSGFTYDEIAKLLGVGKDKIRRVERKLARGGEGYRILVERLLAKRKKHKVRILQSKKRRQRRVNASEFERLKKKYPGPFLLWNIFDELSDLLEAQEDVKDQKKGAREYYTFGKTK